MNNLENKGILHKFASYAKDNERKILNYMGLLNNFEIFGPFLDLPDFFLNRGLIFETSNSDFCDLLEKLFHMAKNTY